MDKVTIIAELGINHGGDYEKALHMIDEAKLTGVSIVKFQFYNAAKLLGTDSPYYEYADSCQFIKEQHEDLKKYCDSVGMEYLVSVFDIKDVAWANKLCKRHKVASRMNQNKEFIEALLTTGKQVIVSTQRYDPTPIQGIDYMYCIPEYPTPVEKMINLYCSPKLGLSSHCPDIEPTFKAIDKGSRIIEHHVCLSKEDEGCDISSSITFGQLRQLQKYANETVRV